MRGVYGVSLPYGHPFAVLWPLGLRLWAPLGDDRYVHGPSRREAVRVVGWSRSMGRLDGLWVAPAFIPEKRYRVGVDEVELREPRALGDQEGEG